MTTLLILAHVILTVINLATVVLNVLAIRVRRHE